MLISDTPFLFDRLSKSVSIPETFEIGHGESEIEHLSLYLTPALHPCLNFIIGSIQFTYKFVRVGVEGGRQAGRSDS